MNYRRKDNPMNGVKVETPRACPEKNHWSNLVIWGLCTGCNRAFTLPNDDTKVFERLENVKKYCV